MTLLSAGYMYSGRSAFYGFDWTYLLALLGLGLTLIASANVNRTFAKYNKVRSMSGLTGATAARYILDSQGLSHIGIEHVSGNLTDHYDPKSKTLRLRTAPTSRSRWRPSVWRRTRADMRCRTRSTTDRWCCARLWCRRRISDRAWPGRSFWPD